MIQREKVIIKLVSKNLTLVEREFNASDLCLNKFFLTIYACIPRSKLFACMYNKVIRRKSSTTRIL